MNRSICLFLLGTCVNSAVAEMVPVDLPKMVVYSPRVANQEPVGTFAMPVSALRFEPRVDVQARNLAEGQADVAIRGGTFENTGFRLGALPLYDPQTGHYFAEIPVASAMLDAPSILTGGENARSGWNAGVGTVAYGWRPIRTAGAAGVGFGEFDFFRGELYQGYASDAKFGNRRLAADVSVAHSSSNGAVPFGEHEFTRYNGRVQLSGESAQTDLVYGYQSKFFGWPNLYTPFNSNETENLQTALVALNHRQDFGGGDFLEAGIYYRRNKDDYAFNRFAPVGPVHPFQHTTRVTGAALDGRVAVGAVSVGYKTTVVRDRLESTSLTFGRFRSRTHFSAGVFPEKQWQLDSERTVSLMAGATYEDTNRDGSAVSPMVVISQQRTAAAGGLRRLYVSYAKTTQVPTYTALNSNAAAGLFRGNPNLGRSTSHNLEVGSSGVWAGWNAEAALFARRDEKLVDWTFRRGVVARTANAVDIDTAGAELFLQRSFDRFDFVFGYAWLGKDASYGSAAVDASFYALNFPTHRVTAAVTARIGSHWELRLDNEARVQKENPLRVRGGDETLLSAAGLYYRPPGVRGLTLALLVDNLWDSEFEEVPAVPAAGRQVAASVNYVW